MQPATDDAEFLVYGSGGFGREVAWLAEQATRPARIVSFIDDAATSATPNVNGIAVRTLDDCVRDHRGAEFVVAVGDPETRARLAERAEAAGLEAGTLVHSRVAMSRFVEIGAGSVICAGTILTVNIRLARHVHINLACTVGHDVVMEDFVTLAPGVNVSGCVRIERGAYIGTGASIINGTPDAPLVIGSNAVVGAGAVVTRDVAPGVIVVGVPAKPRR